MVSLQLNGNEINNFYKSIKHILFLLRNFIFTTGILGRAEFKFLYTRWWEGDKEKL